MTQFTLNTGGIISSVSYTQTKKCTVYVMGSSKPVDFGKTEIAGQVVFHELTPNKLCKNQIITINQYGFRVRLSGVEFLFPGKMKPGEPTPFVARKIETFIDQTKGSR